jgi:hypothetical protein
MLLKNKKNIIKVASLLFFLILIIPFISQAALVTCGNPGQPKCDFDAAIGMINGIIKWIISMAGVLFTIAFIYGGFLWMTSGGDSSKKSKAKAVLFSSLKGFVIILTAWLIIYTILNTLIPKDGTGNSIFQFIGGR